jgi:molecular chaperone IbpA
MTAYGKSLLPATVGFDRLFSTIDEFDRLLDLGTPKQQTYPPYNIIRENDTEYTIEIAISGFSADDIEISTEGGKLSVIGSVKNIKTAAEKYLYRGIGTRNFVHKFTLADTVLVKGANVVDGLLVINLENVIPEERKPRKIAIGINATPSIAK